MRLMIVSDDPLARAGLASLLAEQDQIDLIGQVPGDRSLPAAFELQQPETVVWDLGGESESASWKDDLVELAELGASVVALVAGHAQASEAWACGARGLLSRESAPHQIAAAAAAVAGGLIAIDPEYATQTGLDGSVEPLIEDLTGREREVLGLMAEGLSNKNIALRLEISEHTVKFHVNAILRKLGAQSRTEAVVRATRLGLILL